MKGIVQVPASTTNLGAGFDVLGMALQLYLRVEIDTEQALPLLTLSGEGSDCLPANEENLIFKVIRRVFDGEKLSVPHFRLRVDNQIPIARGLGSSASAIVAGIGCFELLSGRELTETKFFRYAFEFENHPDNLTAARFGGFTVSAVSESGQVKFLSCGIAEGLQILVTVPEFQLETAKARAAIPQHLTLRDAVFNLQRSSLTVAALLKGDFGALREGLRDRIHQPHRATLIPGFGEVLRLNEVDIPGLWGICLSGAGPSVLALADSNLKEIHEKIAAVFARHGISTRHFELQVDCRGRVISQSNPSH